MHQEKLILVFAQALIGTGFIFLYIQHIRGVFEARTNVVHLTPLERESLFQREDALYYNFYKTIVEAPTFLSGYVRLKNLSNIEYPNSINVIHRFHVLPEIIIGALYHFVRSHQGLAVLSLFSCWHSANDNSQLQSTIQYSHYNLCEDQSMQFYTECVWLLGGLTVFTIYMYGLLLSRNVIGGIYAVASYIMFHNFAAKIYERPAARENFAYPAILMQMFCLSFCINQYQKRSTPSHHCFSCFMMLEMTCLTAIALLCWQFSTVIFATQILIMMLQWSLNPVQNRSVNIFLYEYAFTQLSGIFIAYSMSDGNKRYIFAWQLGPAIGLFLISMIRYLKQRFTIATTTSNRENDNNDNLSLSIKMIPMGILISFFSQGTLIDVLEITGFVRSVENSYALYRDLIIHWLLQAKINFITTLTACNPEYKRINSLELWSFIKTLIIKPYCVYGGIMLANFFSKWRKTSPSATSTSAPMSTSASTITENVCLPKQRNADAIERAKNYILEDFLEEHHISMADMINQKKENLLKNDLKLLAQCDYDYDLYKKERIKMSNTTLNGGDEYLQFLDDIKKLKVRIQENNKKQQEQTAIAVATVEVQDVSSDLQQGATTKSSLNIENVSTTTTAATAAATTTTTSNDVDKNKSNTITTTTSTKTKTSINPAPNSINKTNKENANSNRNILLNDYYYANNFHYVYSFLQMVIFTIIGLNIRKLFFLCFTQGCILMSTITSFLLNTKYSNSYYIGQQQQPRRSNYNLYWSVYIYVFLTSIIHPGIMNIQEEYYPISQKAAKDHNELDMLEWIKVNTEKDAVFAGPVDIIGTVHLTTRRPIVNHAHLEMKQISERTERVYSVYSRQQSSDIYSHCSQLKIQYLIIMLNDCTNEIKDDCDLLNIWDDMQPAYRKYPQFCSELLLKNIPSFLKVFTNEKYAIIKMFSHSVQISLKLNKMPEMVM